MIRLSLLLSMTLLLTGCGGALSAADPPGAAPTVTVTVTATETVQVDGDRADPATTWSAGNGPATVSPGPVPKLELEVFDDGCGVIRSEAPAGVEYRNLTWTFRDQDGFQVLGRNAEGETRYRYFAGGVFTVLLEAFVDGRYVAVSNVVTVAC